MKSDSQQFKPTDYRSDKEPTWCKGCSYYGILSALTTLFAQKGLNPARVELISGIGCSSRIALFLNVFAMHTLHGRAIPVAIGSRLARPEIPVVVAAGDGDLFSIGIGHFVHAARKNFNMTVICMDNRMYAMTKNQASPTSSVGYRGSLTPYGKLSVPLNVLEFAIACEATFVSRTFAGSPAHMQEIFSRAFDHEGFSFVEVIAPCRSFDGENPVSRYSNRLIDINRELNHDVEDRNSAVARASLAFEYDTSETVRIPVGVFWEKGAPTFEKQVAEVQKRRYSAATIEELLQRECM